MITVRATHLLEFFLGVMVYVTTYIILRVIAMYKNMI